MEFWSHDDLGGMPPKVYKARFYTHYFKRRFHDCRMPGCKTRMDWDPSKMKKHFMQNHPDKWIEVKYVQSKLFFHQHDNHMHIV